MQKNFNRKISTVLLITLFVFSSLTILIQIPTTTAITTFGKTTIATDSSRTLDHTIGSEYTATAGAIESIVAYVTGGSGNLICALYDSSKGNKVETQATALGGDNWYVCTFASPVTVADANYYLTAVSSSGGSIPFDTTGGLDSAFDAAILPATLTTQTNTWSFSIYAIYSPISGLPAADGYIIGNGTAYEHYNSTGVLQTTYSDFSVGAQNALGNLTAGQTLVVNGSIALNSQFNVTTNNFSIDWYKSNVTMSSALNYGIYQNGYSNITHYSSCNGAKFWGTYDTDGSLDMQIIRGGAGGNNNHVTVENLTFAWVWVIINQGEYATVRNCTFDVYREYAAVFNYQNNSVIAGNTVICNNVGSAFGVFGTEGSTVIQNNATIANNTVTGVGQGFGQNWHWVYVTCTNNTQIYGNTITDAGTASSFSIKSPNTLIYNNTLTMTAGGHGFQIWQEVGGSESVNGSKVYNNTFTGADTALCWAFYEDMVGMSTVNPFDDFLIENNTISHWGNRGAVRLDGGNSTSFIQNVVIKNNTISDCAYGIYAGSGGGTSYVRNINVTSNTFAGTVTTPLFLDTGTTWLAWNNTGLTGYKMLNTSYVGQGTISPDGLGWQYETGSSASVTWAASLGNTKVDFAVDGSNLTTTTSPQSITIDNDHTVIAYFTDNPVPTPTPVPIVYYPGTLNISPLWQYLYEGNLLGWFNAIFLTSFLVEDLVVGAICLLLLAPLYIRTKSLLLICILWIMLGGFFISAVPALSALAIVFMILGVAGLLYRLVRPN